MLAAVSTPRQLVRQVGCSVTCDLGSTVAGATRLIAEASGVALDGVVRFSGAFAITAGAFALGQVLNFGSLAYIVDCNSELRPLHRATPAGNWPLALPPPPELLGADLEVLA